MAWIAAIVAVPAIIGGWFFAAKRKTNKSAASSGAIANTGDVSSGTAGIVTGHHSPVNLSLQVRDGTSQAALSVHRPWIKIDIEIVGDLVEDDRGIRLEFKSRLHNVGNSPATNVQVWVILACGGKALFLRVSL